MQTCNLVHGDWFAFRSFADQVHTETSSETHGNALMSDSLAPPTAKPHPVDIGTDDHGHRTGLTHHSQ